MKIFDNLFNLDFDDILSMDKKNEVNFPEELSFMPRTKRGTINLACAKTGVGKSLFLRQMAACLSKNQYILYISLENDTATDVEHFNVCRNLYPYFNSKSTAFYYTQEPIWNDDRFKQAVSNIPFVFIDGLETTIYSTDSNMFEVYKAEVQKIKDFFPNSCIWLSWQMGRKFESNEPQIEDIAFSYAAARLAYSAVAIYNENKLRVIKTIKCRGGYKEDKGVLLWNEHFNTYKPQVKKQKGTLTDDELENLKNIGLV